MIHHLYNDLGTNRQIGMARGPIPTQAIAWEAARLYMDEVETEALEYVIRRVDDWQVSQPHK